MVSLQHPPRPGIHHVTLGSGGDSFGDIPSGAFLMQCPQFNTIPNSANPNCPQCNHSFTIEIYEKMRFSFSLKNEIGNGTAIPGRRRTERGG